MHNEMYICIYACIRTYACTQTYRQTYIHAHTELLEQSSSKQAPAFCTYTYVHIHICTYTIHTDLVDEWSKVPTSRLQTFYTYIYNTQLVDGASFNTHSEKLSIHTYIDV